MADKTAANKSALNVDTSKLSHQPVNPNGTQMKEQVSPKSLVIPS
jgi:hypothetical protein